ncbi:MAG: HDIG domain-containing metalloprotein [Actinomycetota bacterium]
MSRTQSPADRLAEILLEDDPTDALWASVEAGEMAELVPDFLLLRMEQDPIHRHKDVLAHTIAVTAKTRPELIVRMAAFFHDIGKPRTKRIIDGEVTFRHHEAVGARMVRKHLPTMGFDDETVETVSRLVELSGRFKGYADGWSDSAVRRYARDAGPLLGELNHLVRSDCTTKNPRKVQALQAAMDDLEYRIVELAREDARARERPDIDGAEVMEFLDVPPGPQVGEALRFLLEEKRRDGALGREEALRRLKVWWADRE